MDNDQIRSTLEGEQSRLTGIRDDVRSAGELDEHQQTASGGEMSTVDQHPANVATDTQQREVDLSLLEQIEAELTDVERALAKLSNGSYGRCEVDNEPIYVERLQALPATRFCATHAVNESPGQTTVVAEDAGSRSQSPL